MTQRHLNSYQCFPKILLLASIFILSLKKLYKLDTNILWTMTFRSTSISTSFIVQHPFCIAELPFGIILLFSKAYISEFSLVSVCWPYTLQQLASVREEWFGWE